MSGKKVRLAIVGVGNCASSLVQGLEYYRNAPEDEQVPGLMHVTLGGYHIGDIEIVAAFDVAEGKVGRDVAEAIQAPPNNTIRFAEVPKTGVTVERGPTLDKLTERAVPLGYKAAPEDIANGILWLASDESRYVTGTELVIDGGRSIG